MNGRQPLWLEALPIPSSFRKSFVHFTEMPIFASCLPSIYEYYSPNSMYAVCTVFTSHFLPSRLGLWYPPICNDSPWAFLVKISRTPSSLQNNVLLATGPQSYRVTSCTREPRLCLITTEIMKVEKGFVLPPRTPSAADRPAGIFSCCPCWRADRRAHRGSDVS